MVSVQRNGRIDIAEILCAFCSSWEWRTALPGDDNTREPAWLVDQVSTALKSEQQSLARKLGAAWVGWTTLRPPDKFLGLIVFALAGELVPPALLAFEGGGTLA